MKSQRIIRVFPRRTRATPDDDMVRVAQGPGLFDEADEVHVSVTFTWDLPIAEQLAREWELIAPVKIGGPATGEPSGDFQPSMYLKQGYVITSRGCPNRCWFCQAWRREGDVRELPIAEGWNVLDDNLLACSDEHIKAVFSMLARQRGKRIEFTGGLEAARLQPWHAETIRALRPKQVFFAYDEPGDLEPLRAAGKMLSEAGFTRTSHALRAYVLCGFSGDSLAAAERRMKETVEAGFWPMAMLYRGDGWARPRPWTEFQFLWARPGRIPLPSSPTYQRVMAHQENPQTLTEVTLNA